MRKYKTAEASQKIREIGLKLIAEKKAAILEAGGDAMKLRDFEGRDLLSLLIKSNMASDLPESARMSDEDILARALVSSCVLCHYADVSAEVPTFIVAGHETTR
jgi:cytochrome P450